MPAKVRERLATVQFMIRDEWATKAPRPELMPTRMRIRAVQAKTAARWPGALRPDLLPGMGTARVKLPGRVAQRRSGDGVKSALVPDERVPLVSVGKPLEAAIREPMEDFFGADFSAVRIREGPVARAIGAQAFTLGETLYFLPGRYKPTTRAGLELLGHELTHVLQQRHGRAENPYGRGLAIVQDPKLEAEADTTGRLIAERLWPITKDSVRAKRNRTVRGGLIAQRADTNKRKPARRKKDTTPPLLKHWKAGDKIFGATSGNYTHVAMELADRLGGDWKYYTIQNLFDAVDPKNNGTPPTGEEVLDFWNFFNGRDNSTGKNTHYLGKPHLAKRTSKAAIEYLYYKGRRIHFMLDGIDSQEVVNKASGSISANELRYICRNWNKLQNTIIFYNTRGDKLKDPPWKDIKTAAIWDQWKKHKDTLGKSIL